MSKALGDEDGQCVIQFHHPVLLGLQKRLDGMGVGKTITEMSPMSTMEISSWDSMLCCPTPRCTSVVTWLLITSLCASDLLLCIPSITHRGISLWYARSCGQLCARPHFAVLKPCMHPSLDLPCSAFRPLFQFHNTMTIKPPPLSSPPGELS